ncbi:MAG TPA: SRPBCC family protein [Gemmatimonadaceae bacterium]|nr:SRPBCC family protein [Gemmatimonadaceae bacterium]
MMTTREQYMPGPAAGAHIESREGEKWTLVLVRELHHSPKNVWEALTDPAQLREWAPYDADRNMGTAGATVKLSTFGAPSPQVNETKVKRADAPKLLEFDWGGGDLRWELEPVGTGTRLTLWAKIDRNWVSMGAAGWHICLDVLDHLLDGDPIGRIAGIETMKFDGWKRLMREYGEQFGTKAPSW